MASGCRLIHNVPLFKRIPYQRNRPKSFSCASVSNGVGLAFLLLRACLWRRAGSMALTCCRRLLEGSLAHPVGDDPRRGTCYRGWFLRDDPEGLV